MALHPAVEWAQRTDKIFLTILVDDFKNPAIECSDDKLTIKGVGGASKKNYECELEFFKPINSEGLKKESSDRCLSFVLPKKESGAYWPRLLKSNQKYHWLKVDFDKWKDEDEQDEGNFDDQDNDMGFGNMMGNMGDMPPYEDDFDENEQENDLEDKSESEDDESPGPKENGAEKHPSGDGDSSPSSKVESTS